MKQHDHGIREGRMLARLLKKGVHSAARGRCLASAGGGVAPRRRFTVPKAARIALLGLPVAVGIALSTSNAAAAENLADCTKRAQQRFKTCLDGGGALHDLGCAVLYVADYAACIVLLPTTG